jgi:hypothetical protein
MNHLLSWFETLIREAFLLISDLDMRSLEGLLLIGTLVIVLALILIAVNRKKSPFESF